MGHLYQILVLKIIQWFKIIKFTKGLLSLQDIICSLFRDISIISNDENRSSEKIWPYTTSIISMQPSVVANYVIRNLSKSINPSIEEPALEELSKWIPGRSESPYENEIFEMYKFDPFQYWLEMSQHKGWKNLASVVLRIIPIPPTEAACERVFSARREIMTKHVSHIRDSVVEARAHLKAGIYEQTKQ